MNQSINNNKLPVGKVILGALVVPWVFRRMLVRNLSTTSFLIVLLGLAGSQTQIIQKLPYWISPLVPLVYLVLWLIVFTRFAVICHRTVLLGPDAKLKPFQFFSWSRRESAFLVRLFLVYLLVGLATIVFTQFLGTILGNIPSDKSFLKEHFNAVEAVAEIPATYVLARFCLLLPAAALDNRQSFPWAYRISSENGTRIAIVVGVLPWLLDWLVYEATMDGTSLLLNLVYYLVTLVAMVIEISLLSLSYKELVGTTLEQD